jgi:hypothetical protein
MDRDVVHCIDGSSRVWQEEVDNNYAESVKRNQDNELTGGIISVII